MDPKMETHKGLWLDGCRIESCSSAFVADVPVTNGSSPKVTKRGEEEGQAVYTGFLRQKFNILEISTLMC